MGISIIIPTLNEERLLPILLRHLRKYEVIVVDGGSKDKTVEIAKNFGASVVVSNKIFQCRGILVQDWLIMKFSYNWMRIQC